MLEALFMSKTRVEILKLMLLDPKGRFYVREVAARTGVSPRGAQVELARLAHAGVLVREVSGRQVYYEINEQCPIVGELRAILIKTAGVADVVRDRLRPLAGSILYAFIYGSFARGDQKRSSDVDVMVIGSVGFDEVVTALTPAQDTLGREVNPTVFSSEEFQRRCADRDHFITSVMRNPRLMLLGDENELEAVGAVSLAG